MNKILDGKEYSKKLKAETKERVEKLKEKTGKVPKLVTIMVGDSEASLTYVNMKEKACINAGIDAVNLQFPKITTEDLIKEIEKLNKDDTVSGILIQHPLPREVDEQKCIETIDPAKDVDGLTQANFAKLCMTKDALMPCTPKGIIDLMHEYKIDLAGKHAVVIGRSQILGKPLAMMLLNENATVTITHSKTKDIEKIIKKADIVCACCGQPKFVKPEWVKRGQILIDAGYNAGNIGDIDPEAYLKARYYTPVPGGVGPMTVAELLSQTVDAFEKQNNLR
jgi:methylenetetrahydrofolate dehydrogenase (NADP+)/methenyltetrahydrofolate cyclohydrolase